MQPNPHKRGNMPNPARQGGATLVMVAGLLLALLAVLVLAIEVGRLYAAQTSLQRTADVAALDAARAIGGCNTGVPPENLWAAAQQAVTGAIDSHDHQDVSITDEIELGTLDDRSNSGTALTRLRFASGTATPDSVRVTLTRPPPVGLTQMIVASERQLQATAAAHSSPRAGIKVGSRLVDVGGVEGNNGLLSALLGGPVDLSVASYEALLGTNVTLGDLVAVDASIATPEELLKTTLTLPQALAMLSAAVDITESGLSGRAGNALDDLAAVADPGRTVVPSQILGIEEGLETGLSNLPLNVGGLLSGLAQAANEGATVSLPVGIDLGGLARVDVRLNVIDPPKTAFGRAGRGADGEYRTVAYSPQIALEADIEVLGALPEAMGGAVVNLPLYLRVASAEARLEAIHCSSPLRGRPQHEVDVGVGTSIAALGVGEFQNLNSPDPEPAPNQEIVLVNAAGIAQVVTTRGLQVDLGTGSGAREETFIGPFPPTEGAEPQTIRSDTSIEGALSYGLTGLSQELAEPGTLDVRLLGTCFPLICDITNALLAPVVGVVIGLLQPVLAILDTLLLGPLLELLGVSIGTADTTVEAVLVDQPRIFSREIAEE